MSKRTAAKHKIDRRMGENLWGRPNHLLTEENMDLVNMAREEKLNYQILEFNLEQSKN